MVYTEIISGLWISNIDMIYNKQFLKDNDITIIINCTVNYKFNNESTIKNVRIPLVEDLYSNIDMTQPLMLEDNHYLADEHYLAENDPGNYNVGYFPDGFGGM